jgi:hypothetical protein
MRPAVKTRIGLLLILPLLWLAPLLGGFGQIHNAPGAAYSDLTVAHWPSAEFLRQSILQSGEIPMWNPNTLGGTPFAADPLSGIYYPPLWLALVVSPPLAFNILFLLHLALAGVGAFLLAREEGASNTGALLAGIAFGGLPKFVAHVAAGHLTLVLAAAWTPWLLLAARNAARKESLRGWSLAGFLAGVIFLADPRWIIPSGLAAIGYAFAASRKNPPIDSRRERILTWVRQLVVFAGFTAAISAILALPMAEFTSLSTRVNLPASESAMYSLPIRYLSGLFFGGIVNPLEWVVYPGAVVMLFALVPLFIRSTFNDSGAPGNVSPPANYSYPHARKEGWFWLAVFLISVLLSLGSNIPGLGTLTNAIPAVNLLRVPPRWMFLAGLALAMLAARGLTVLEGTTDKRGILKKVGFALAAGGLILAAAAGAAGLPAILWQDGLLWGGMGLILCIGMSSGRWTAAAGVALVGLAVLDLAVADFRLIDPHPAAIASPDVGTVVSFLENNAAGYRVYSPSYSIPALNIMEGNLRSLDGIDPLMLRSTVQTVSAASGVPAAGYSVTLPAFASGEPAVDNSAAVPDPRALGLLNVRYIVSAFAIPGAAFTLREKAGGIFLYENPLAMPRAWIAGTIDGWDQPIEGRMARVESESPNRIRLTAEGPGWLILAEAAYPAWRATVDGKPAAIRAAGGWWRAVEIGPGIHEVQMSYDPSLSAIGAVVTLLAALAFLGVRRWAK